MALFTEQFRSDPHPSLGALRDAGPVHEVEAPGGIPIWLVTRWEDARRVLTDPSLTKRRPQPRFLAPHLHEAISNHMLLADPPDHTRLRRLVSAAFTARRTEALRPRVQQITDDLLDALAGAGDAPVDLIDEFAFPLPIQVICELLGVPVDDRDSFRRWSNILVAGPSAAAELPGVVEELVSYSLALLRQVRAAPRDDLLSALIAVRDEGDRLTDDELVSMVFLLLVAGHETTVNLIGNGVHLLCGDTGRRDRLVADPGLLPAAVEEFLRFESPVATTTFRMTTSPIEVGGTTIPAGAQVLVSLLAANRDERHFTDPGEFDLGRSDNQHLAFGHGIHYCLGAPLARLEGQVAIGSLLARFPKLRAAETADGLRWRPGLLIRGLTTLPVHLT